LPFGHLRRGGQLRPPHRPMDVPDAAVANRWRTLKMLSRGGRLESEIATGLVS